MNKKDLIPVILLALLIPAWMFIDRTFIAPKYPAKTPAPVEQAATEAPLAGNTEGVALPETAAEAATKVAQAIPEAVVVPDEEVTGELSNDIVKLTVTSLGGGIKTATLLEYPKFKGEPDPVVLDFSGATALAYEGLAGIGDQESLNIKTLDDSKTAVFTKTWKGGTAFERTITLGNGYLLTIKDRFINSSPEPWNIPAIRILTGPMQNPPTIKAMKGVSILGVDSYAPIAGINYWGRKLNKLFKEAGKPETLDAVPEGMSNMPVDWVAAKNKFFTQILSPTEPIATMALLCQRDPAEKGILPSEIRAALAFKPAAVNAGDALELDYTYFIGPKKYSTLEAVGNNMQGVMEFETTGIFSFMNWLMEPARRALLWTLNLFYGIVRNYGIAIILLTLLVRILFWPLTHKSTESMRRMQEIQPEVKALQAKYGKANPQKLQQETMKLYKEKKVNPMGGCLPMVVQIPVFIALFTVLRNAIELRYAGFLWISDLSTAENLFAGQIPFVGSLNILPLLMSASMVWQQKMTPTAVATPEQQQQQKMMTFMMPIMMLFFFYTMPSGLVLYWTTSNLLMIAQTGLRNLKKKKAEA
ncbi:membrane protein insertase YidC [Pontiella sulfatireligans]|uniref:Membrane protein insertase YidC n=1 Tax=Pontiella sulfatireligans TaxID=2750658 RepID=A0A6C2UMG2_9BACT|nr:membrane protein insertase YidC [Pontiella sulfatireligans]VGO21189.1 Membrane protein insertase YidC [Pontiella sulfatireligans]